jgi:phosphotransferase system enzyme I (PtsP)
VPAEALALARAGSSASGDSGHFVPSSLPVSNVPRVAERYDPLSPPALRALQQIQIACAETGTPVSVCGEMAGRPLEAFALVALGFDRLSMPPAGIGPVKQMVLSVDREAAQRGVLSLLKGASGSVRNEIETLARKLYVAI